jgi:hypothetical protein
MAKPIQKALEVLKTAQAEVNKLLNEPEHNGNLLEINTHFKRIESRLLFMGGSFEPSTNGKKDNEPIKRFMGKELPKDVALTKEMLSPKDADKKAFIAKVDKLYEQIGRFTPQEIITNYRLPEDILVIRGVAKRAGVVDYESADLTISFIENIIDAIEINNEETEKQQSIDQQTKATKADKKEGK